MLEMRDEEVLQAAAEEDALHKRCRSEFEEAEKESGEKSEENLPSLDDLPSLDEVKASRRERTFEFIMTDQPYVHDIKVCGQAYL